MISINFLLHCTSPVYATLIYHILVAAHELDICTPATAHHPNFSHLLYAAGGAGGGWGMLVGAGLGILDAVGAGWEGGACRG